MAESVHVPAFYLDLVMISNGKLQLEQRQHGPCRIVPLDAGISFKSIIFTKEKEKPRRRKQQSRSQSAFCLSKQETINTQIWEINTRQQAKAFFHANHARYLAIGEDYNAKSPNAKISTEKRRKLFLSINVVSMLRAHTIAFLCAL